MYQDQTGKSPSKAGQKAEKPVILVAPLDWGLGHVTRCIPLVHELVKQGAAPVLAGNEAAKALLTEEFPHLPFLDLPGYDVRYAKTATGLFFNMIRQSGKILTAIKKEHKWLKEQQAMHGFDAVISDNRYGLYHPDVYSVIMTHQLQIKSPVGGWSEAILRKRNYTYFSNFNSCWVPDFPEAPGLAGDLSHPLKKPVTEIVYTGPLSRFRIVNQPIQKSHLLFIVSGPEPQRTILENIFINEMSHYNGTAALVRGLPSSKGLIPSSNMLKVYNHLSAKDMQEEMAKAEFVIGRCGYSTVMDIVALQKKSLLIPTPGQTEQEYLAAILPQKGIACTVSQKDFTLASSLGKAKSFTYHLPPPSQQPYLQQAVTRLLQQVHRQP